MVGNNLFIIEKAEIVHLKQIKQIESECGLSSWSPADYRQEIERKDSFFYICKINGKLVGFILARLITIKTTTSNLYKDINSQNGVEVENEVEIYNIGIRKKYRRSGIGSLLVDKLIEKFRQHNIKKIWLEVRISNSHAIGFYKSKGFKIIGTRRNLYTHPPEGGFVMCLEV